MVSRPRALLVLLLAVGPALLGGCDVDCGCDSQYEDCLAKAPPGAAKADCAQRYDTCQDQCDASKVREEAEYGMH